MMMDGPSPWVRSGRVFPTAVRPKGEANTRKRKAQGFVAMTM
jgi:hypothetical protein